MDQERIDREERGSLETYYERLTPAERRERILLAPAYRDLYHAITQAHRAVEQPLYFWDRWVPVLGPVASVLYMKLRQYCFQGPSAKAREDWCWPNQEALAKEIGIKSRVSIREALLKLEALGFIRRGPTYRRDPSTGRPQRGSDAYCVFFELPLTTVDAIELLIGRSEAESSPDLPYKVEIDPHRDESQESIPYEVENRPHYAGRKSTPLRWSKIDPITLVENRPASTKETSNVNVNVCRQEFDHKTPPLVLELVETLEDPDSINYYRLLVRKLPENLIRIALSETKAARLERRLTGRPGAYFTGAAKALAAEAGIDL